MAQEDLAVSELSGKDGRQEGPRPPPEPPCSPLPSRTAFPKLPLRSGSDRHVPLADAPVTNWESTKGAGAMRCHPPGWVDGVKRPGPGPPWAVMSVGSVLGEVVKAEQHTQSPPPVTCGKRGAQVQMLGLQGQPGSRGRPLIHRPLPGATPR